MNKITGLLFGTLLILCLFVQSNAQTIVKGTIDNKDLTTLYVKYTDADGFQNETVAVNNGEFEWSKPIEFPSSVSFSLTKNAGHAAAIWTEPSSQTLFLKSEDLEDYILEGSDINSLVKVFESSVKTENDQISELGMQMQLYRDDKEKVDSLRAVVIKIFGVLTQRGIEFIEKNPDSYYSPYLLSQLQLELTDEQMQHYLGMITGAAVNSPYVKKLREKEQWKIDGYAGKKAPLFTGLDINGNMFDLGDLIGKKYIILDFWASWCVPCRKGNPHLKELYSKYKDDGLAVVCIADDDSSEDAWKKAVETDGVEMFTHVLRGWKGMEYFFSSQDPGTKYGVEVLPTKFLIGKDGVILGRYLGGEMIDPKLEEIFGH